MQLERKGPFHKIRHPNDRGTGTALRIQLQPARESFAGFMSFNIAEQKRTEGIDDKNKIVPVSQEFDWEDGITVFLEAEDLGEMLRVLIGECENVKIEKKPIDGLTQTITVQHITGYPDYDGKYVFRFSSCFHDKGHEIRIILSGSEGLVLCRAIESSMSLVCFGHVV